MKVPKIVIVLPVLSYYLRNTHTHTHNHTPFCINKLYNTLSYFLQS